MNSLRECKWRNPKTEPWGSSALRDGRDKQDGTKETGNEQPGRWEENQECGTLKVKARNFPE